LLQAAEKFIPGYQTLLASGELGRRVAALQELLTPCRLCPWQCQVDRAVQLGHCSTGPEPLVASTAAHFGEEPVVSGHRGSGTIFLANCNMRCVYCQNHQISQDPGAFPAGSGSHQALAEKMLSLQRLGCHNINWVTPTHQVAALVRALEIAAKEGLNIPIVYNTSGYDSVETLGLLQGVVDIYMPDLRYAKDEAGAAASGVADYPAFARGAVAEMFRQVGADWDMDDGVLRRGLLIRLLVLPSGLSGTEQTLRWISETLSPRVGVSLMSQYYPAHHAGDVEWRNLLGRTISATEWQSVLDAHERWMSDEQGFIQDLYQSPQFYRPDFSDRENPFRS
jgi:putative pyruvate formate lyase activating enzyme